jgi:hypothetical protein
VQRRTAVHSQDVVGQRNLQRGRGNRPAGMRGPESIALSDAGGSHHKPRDGTNT